MTGPVVSIAVATGVAAALADFDATADRAGFVSGSPSYVIELPNDLTREPAILLYLLRDVCGFADLGPLEKTAWECTFAFRSVPASIAAHKTGVYLYLERSTLPDRGAARRTAGWLYAALRRGMAILENGALRPFARQQLELGNVTVLNQWHRLREMYEYFRAGAEAAYQGHGRIPAQMPGGGSRIFREETEGYYNAIATVNAYFSALEHILLIAFPFARLDDPPALRSFLRMRWYEKFGAVFDLATDRRAKRVYDRLREVADHYRNPHVHGGVDTRSGSVAFHLPGCGAVSLSLREPELTPSLFVVPFDRRGFGRATYTFSAVDTLLRTHRRTRYGLRWADAGLDVAFDAHSMAAARDASLNNRRFAEFLEARSRAWERAVNMEW